MANTDPQDFRNTLNGLAIRIRQAQGNATGLPDAYSRAVWNRLQRALAAVNGAVKMLDRYTPEPPRKTYAGGLQVVPGERSGPPSDRTGQLKVVPSPVIED